MKVLSAALVINASHALLEAEVSPCYHQQQQCADGTLTWGQRQPCGDSRGLLHSVLRWHVAGKASPRHPFSTTPLLRDSVTSQQRIWETSGTEKSITGFRPPVNSYKSCSIQGLQKVMKAGIQTIHSSSQKHGIQHKVLQQFWLL